MGAFLTVFLICGIVGGISFAVGNVSYARFLRGLFVFLLGLAQQFWPTAPSSNALNPCAIPDCPITPRLATRADELVKIESGYKTGSVDIWCRCQQYFDVKITAEVTPAGGTAHVASGSLKMDFIMVLQDGKLLLDDTQCTGGGPSTSIYTSQGLNPCEAIES